MKKNRMMRLASVLLVLTLLSTSVISGTFAKYVTSDTASDTARVAKFGVVVSASGTLFSDKYVDLAGGNVPGSTGLTVKSSDTDKLVAPGTESATSGLALSVTGTPEVKTTLAITPGGGNEDIYLANGEYGVMVKATGITAENFATAGTLYTRDPSGVYSVASVYGAELYRLKDVVNVTDATDTVTGIDRFRDNKYYPVVWTVNGTGCESVADVCTAITPSTVTYDANTVLSSVTAFGSAKTIKWKWQFEATDTSNKDLVDGADTILGDMMAQLTGDAEVVSREGSTYKAVKYVGNAVQNQAGTEIAYLQISFEVTITVTQVD